MEEEVVKKQKKEEQEGKQEVMKEEKVVGWKEVVLKVEESITNMFKQPAPCLTGKIFDLTIFCNSDIINVMYNMKKQEKIGPPDNYG